MKSDPRLVFETRLLLEEIWYGHFAYETPRLLDISPTRHFAYYLDSSPTDCSLCQQYYKNKIEYVGLI